MSGGGILDAKQIVRDYLLERPAVEDLEARVVGKTPPSTSKPWVHISLVDPQNATGINRVEHLVSYYMQLDCYAGESGGEPVAFELARAVRKALIEEMPGAKLDDAVTTDAVGISMRSEPDTKFTPTRDRFIVEIEIYMHPKP